MRKSQSSNTTDKPEPPARHPSTRLIDILVPPGNRWLAELSRCRDLPAGVRIVRFGNDEDLAEEAAEPPARSVHPARRRSPAATAA
jgi:hypothetical protein